MSTGPRGPTLGGMVGTASIGAVIDLNGAPHYVHHGWFLISDANLVVIGLMIVVFVLAIWLPFPGARRRG
jgi:hypothetical protein